MTMTERNGDHPQHEAVEREPAAVARRVASLGAKALVSVGAAEASFMVLTMGRLGHVWQDVPEHAMALAHALARLKGMM